ncbi:MAG: formyltransferase family protein [Nitrospinota bacterium]|nr:formyltransferase family protein [Nitrospinota bacterium]MDH5790100.1 formyltransferase family protein [Nitrospinota bacterium]
MRVGILATSFRAGIKIFEVLAALQHGEVYLLNFPAGKKVSFWKRAILFLSALLSAKPWRLPQLLWTGNVILFSEALDHPKTLSRIKELNLDIGLHKSESIYRDPTIRAFKQGILNAHIGLLPQYRGRCVMEWTILQGDRTGVSVFFIDAGIDTGERMVFSREIDVSGFESIEEAKSHLFSHDAECYKTAVQKLQTEDFKFEINDGSGARYYVMSNLFFSVVGDLLKENPIVSPS